MALAHALRSLDRRRRGAASVALGLLVASLAACGSSHPASSRSRPRPAPNAAGGGAGGAATPTPVISRDQPAFASSQTYPAAAANDIDYSTAWRSSGYPCWLAYDLSAVPAGRRRRVYSEWSNAATYNYDNSVFPSFTYNVPSDYVIEANRAPGGSTPPATGWVTMVRVTANTYHSGAQMFDMTGYNWVRFHASSGSSYNAPQNTDCAINWDIHDASTGAPDAWIFYGDSITAGAMAPSPLPRDRNGAAVDTFAKRINAFAPSRFPAQQDGAIGGLTLAYAISKGLFEKWLAAYPGKYVAIALGANDVDRDGFSADGYYTNLAAAATEVERAGKTPVIPTLVASRTPNIEAHGPDANDKIRMLYRTDPRVVPGPDFWALFASHPEWISADGLHPNDTGYGEIRKAWVESVMSSIYASSAEVVPNAP